MEVDDKKLKFIMPKDSQVPYFQVENFETKIVCRK